MKKDWGRSTPVIEVDQSNVGEILNLGSDIISIELLLGGLSNTNYLIETTQNRFVLRIVADPNKAILEKEVTATLIGMIPIPAIKSYHRISNNDVDQYWFQLEFKKGSSLSSLLPDLDSKSKSRIYNRAGIYLSKISAFEFEETGFLGKDLEIRSPLTITSSTYCEIIDYNLSDIVRSKLDHLPTKIEIIAQNMHNLLDECDPTPRLCHGDYNPENMLIDDGRIAAILDWEFSISLSPMLDIGNFLRFEDDLDAPHVKAFCRGYETGGRSLPPSWRQIIRLYDLISLLTLIDQDAIDLNRLIDIRERITRYIDELGNEKSTFNK